MTLTEAGRRRARRCWTGAATSSRRALLAPLSSAQRERLVDAMGTVERLLTAGLVEIAEEDPASADAQFCLRAYYAELDARFDDGFESGADAARATTPSCSIARLRGEPVGCGAIKARRELDQAHVGLAHGRAASASAGGC